MIVSRELGRLPWMGLGVALLLSMLALSGCGDDGGSSTVHTRVISFLDIQLVNTVVNFLNYAPVRLGLIGA